jgi:membrane dipeptidase
MRNIAKWNGWLRAFPDLIVKARSVADIRHARREGRTAIVLGFQNVSAFEDRLDAILLFKELGVGIAQIAYNTQNMAGTGCYESRDAGLSDFGHDVVAEMNRVGIMCDLSHVAAVTSRDVILASSKPVCYSHCLPSALKPHPRNKTDEELRFIADHGGFVGVTMFAPFLPKGPASTVDDYVSAIQYVIDLIGDDQVGIGTDFTQGHGPGFFDWITRDKGDGRKLTEFGEIVNPDGFRLIGEYPNLLRAMGRAGWSTGRIERIAGENWLRVLAEVWGG